MISNKKIDVVFELNLDQIKMKLMHVESGEGWSAERAQVVEFEYRRFLYLMKMFPNEQFSPSVDVDTFWHYHILDTAKYARDCEQALGFFLHHYPYVGLGEDSSAAQHQRSGERMRELYEGTFGEVYGCLARLQDPAYCAAPSPAQSTQTVQAAYCASSVNPAYCASRTKTAYCAAPSPAQSSQTAQAAYCASSVKAAYCASNTKAAYCAAPRPAQSTQSTQIVQVAYCASNVKSAYCAANDASKTAQADSTTEQPLLLAA
jgi:hypothetical protein